MFVPETLMTALSELSAEYQVARLDEEFQRELAWLLREYAGRPTPLYFAERLTGQLGGAKIYLKREDLLHTGAHKINNALGQILVAQRMGKKRIRCSGGGNTVMSWMRSSSVWLVLSTGAYQVGVEAVITGFLIKN